MSEISRHCLTRLHISLLSLFNGWYGHAISSIAYGRRCVDGQALVFFVSFPAIGETRTSLQDIVIFFSFLVANRHSIINKSASNWLHLESINALGNKERFPSCAAAAANGGQSLVWTVHKCYFTCAALQVLLFLCIAVCVCVCVCSVWPYHVLRQQGRKVLTLLKELETIKRISRPDGLCHVSWMGTALHFHPFLICESKNGFTFFVCNVF